MNFDTVNPLDIKENWSLTSIFPDMDKKIYVWTDYTSGEILFTMWDSTPEEFYIKRPVAQIYENKYSFSKNLPCSRTLNYGPATGGLGEAGAFKIQTCGERIDRLTPVLGFKNRNLGEKVTGKLPHNALIFIEKFVGQFSISYASLFTLLAFEVSDPCKRYIYLANELERIHNHLWIIHKLASDASQKVASAHLAAITEEMMRINLKVLGHRYGMGFIRLGPRTYHGFYKDISNISSEFKDLSEELLDSRIFIDRLHTTCTLKKTDVVKNDIAGIPSRAVGLHRDARNIGILRDYYKDYKSPMEEDGDSLARLLIRVEEVIKSFESLESLEYGPCNLHPKKNGFYYGLIEAPPGDAFMGIRIDDNKIKDFMFRPASLPLYHAFSIGIINNVFTDFPFALDSFGLYFSDADSFGRWS